MICPSCAHENRQGAKFCEECAAPLRHACASCGSELRPTAKFCDECGAPAVGSAAVAPPSEPAGARKVVTIVFADLVGSTALQERLDPESARRFMESYYAAMRAAVESHAGSVTQLLGDGVKAAFGIPRVAEDDAIRAVRAAVATQRARAHDRKRKYVAEPPFAWIKSVMGFRRFRLRGVRKVTAEWSLACLAANLRRMNHLMEWA